ncbi:MAG: YqcC family protein [Alcanivoracaceae bacterium]
MTDPRRDLLLQLLSEIEAELRELGVWSTQAPAQQAFMSTTPFFADRMAFEQWLQWVMVARFRALIEGDLPLPETCQIAPMAEQALSHLPHDVSQLISLLASFDAQFN